MRVPPVDVLPLSDAARAHQMIDTGHVRGKLVLKVAELEQIQFLFGHASVQMTEHYPMQAESRGTGK